MVFVPTDATALSQAHFGPGSLPILMRNVDCSGSEEQLTNCPFSSQAAAICSHSEDAGVQCQIERKILQPSLLLYHMNALQKKNNEACTSDGHVTFRDLRPDF